MKRDFIAPILMLGLVLSTLAASVMGYQTLKGARMMRFLQEQTARVNQRRAGMQALAIDLNEYARREQSIIPMLERLNLRPRPGTNAVPAKP